MFYVQRFAASDVYHRGIRDIKNHLLSCCSTVFYGVHYHSHAFVLPLCDFSVEQTSEQSFFITIYVYVGAAVSMLYVCDSLLRTLIYIYIQKGE